MIHFNDLLHFNSFHAFCSLYTLAAALAEANSSLSGVNSIQLVGWLILTLITAHIVSFVSSDLDSVWIFLRIENALSASALEMGRTSNALQGHRVCQIYFCH